MKISGGKSSEHFDTFSGGSVVEAHRAYRGVLARHGLADFTRQEIDGAMADLQSQECFRNSRLGSRDVRFHAAVARLKARRELSQKAVEKVLHELLNAEYDCDQAEWERDCQRWATMSHAEFKAPGMHKPVHA